MRYLHIKGVSVKADFSAEDEVLYRYRLEIQKDGAPRSARTVCAIMQNPSYAGEEIADKSVQFLEKNILQLDLPEFQNVGRLIIVNQFAQLRYTFGNVTMLALTHHRLSFDITDIRNSP